MHFDSLIWSQNQEEILYHMKTEVWYFKKARKEQLRGRMCTEKVLGEKDRI